MGSGIFLIQGDQQLVEMTEQSYATKDILQSLLAKYPSLLAGNQMNPTAPRKWLLVSRETPLASELAGAGRWSVDHLFLDQDAVPTIVEVKRSSDTRIRREVVGQILEYAANAVLYWPIQKLISQFETTCATKETDPAEVLASFLGEEEDTDTFWERVRTNLQAGRVRLVFVADYIAPELQRIVEFLNGQMNPAEVLAVQIKQYVGEGFKTLIPRVIGQTAQAQQSKSVGGGDFKEWDETSVFQTMEERHGTNVTNVARSILAWAKDKHLLIVMSKGKKDAGFSLLLDNEGIKHYLVTIWSYASYPKARLEVPFDYMKLKPFSAELERNELVKRLNAIPDVNKHLIKITGRLNIPLELFQEPEAMNKLLETIEWAVQQIKVGTLYQQGDD